MSAPSSIRIVSVSLYFIPVEMRLQLKFGAQALDSVTCARACVRVIDKSGKSAEGWGETPLSVAWAWPSQSDYETRHTAFKEFTRQVATALTQADLTGHPIEIGHRFVKEGLGTLCEQFNGSRSPEEALPHLASLVAFSLFDLAIHDAYATLHQVPVYESYHREFLPANLDQFIEPAKRSLDYRKLHLSDFLVKTPAKKLPVWHLIGGLDPLSEEELCGDEPDDGYPVLLHDWIRRDGLNCLKIKLCGNDQAWDRARLQKVGRIAREEGVTWLSADFNCTVSEPAYVNEILDELRVDDPVTFQKILYVEQPFPYDLDAHQIEVHSVSARKPLFMDESAHDWTYLRKGRELGWNGVALKTCKTQTGALLSAAFAKSHGMGLMVQDLTNPMLAQIPHFQLAAHVGTIMGVESNGMQFYPAASEPEAKVHPGLFQRRKGMLDGSTLRGAGFGYRLSEIERELPVAVYE